MISKFFLCIVFAFSLSMIADERVYPCYLIKGEQGFSQKNNEATWERIPDASGFYIFKSDKFVFGAQTFFKAYWTEDALHLKVRCYQANADRLNVSKKNNDNLWKKDCVEVHIAPKGEKSKCQFIINPKGARWSAGCALSAWKLQADSTKEYWFFKAIIPFEVFGGKPKPNAEWKVNISRLAASPRYIYSTWSENINNFHDLTHYNKFLFKTNLPTSYDKFMTEARLNGAFINALRIRDKKKSKRLGTEKRKIRTFFHVETRNANAKLFVGGKHYEWKTRTPSLSAKDGASGESLSSYIDIDEGPNVIGIKATATGAKPSVKIEVGRKESDLKWKYGTVSGVDWFNKDFNDSAWNSVTPEKGSFYWSKGREAAEVYFRQIYRGIEKSSQNVKYGIKKWNKKGFGFHRAIVRVDKNTGSDLKAKGLWGGKKKTRAVWAHIPWRRRDENPDKKAVIVIDAYTGKRLDNVVLINNTKEYGDIVFEPLTVPGNYEVYYLPYYEVLGNAPWYWSRTDEYIKPHYAPDPNWEMLVAWIIGNKPKVRFGKIKNGNWQRLPKAELLEIQAKSKFDRFDPMEVVATKEEIEQVLEQNKSKEYLLFPEDRKHPVRMYETIPLCWVKKSGLEASFAGSARPGEFYCFQVGVLAAQKSISNVDVEFGALKNDKGESISQSEFRCFNIDGTDWLGKTFRKTFKLAKGKVRPLWIGFQVPDNAKGLYRGTVTIKPAGMKPEVVKISIDVAGSLIPNKGDDDLWRHSRLRWLDSTLGLNENDLSSPYMPLKVKGNKVELLDRSIEFGRLGLPIQVKSRGKNILSKPISLTLEKNGQSLVLLKSEPDKIIKEKPAKFVRESFAEDKNASLSLKNISTTEFDGCVQFEIKLKAKKDELIDKVILEIPFAADVAEYMMGAGKLGGYRPDTWSWTKQKNILLWVGNVVAGIQLKTNGISSGTLRTEGNEVILRSEISGIKLAKDKEYTLKYRLLVTPFKPINKIHWKTRVGTNIEHIHHSNKVNPYINYPFICADKLAEKNKKLIKSGGLGVQLYYTVRELSNHVAEMWALRSLGNEVFSGPDVYASPVFGLAEQGHPWLREHLKWGYNKAWRTPVKEGTCAAIGTTGLSRWHNYYIEGLNYLLRKNAFYSLYLDGIGYDRDIMKRVAIGMSKANPDYRMEFHVCCGRKKMPKSVANINMEHLPFVTELWFGEFFNYNRGPDYWLVEISGIPFGLTGEMLDITGTANFWRGMLYGLTCRQEKKKAKEIYKLWDEFGIENAEWLGYWNPECPVKTGRKDILATVYRKKNKALICLASWTGKDEKIKLKIDWQKMGLDPQKITLTALALAGLQKADKFKINDKILVPKNKEVILIAE